MTIRTKPVLAICGGGNAGHALAIVTSQRFDGDILWLAGSEEKAETLRRTALSGGLRSSGVITGAADRIRLISSNPAQVIPQADVVLIAVPAFAHAIVLKQIAPFLGERALLGVLPSRSGFEFQVAAELGGIDPEGDRTVFGLQTLPWSTRVQETGVCVNFGALKANVLVATIPAERAPRVAAHLTGLLGTNVVPTGNFLNMTLGNPGQFIHPGLMYGFFGAWNGGTYCETEIPYFYAHADDRIGAFVERLSDDAIRVARHIESRSPGLDLSGVLQVTDWLRISYPTQTKDLSTAATSFRTGPLQHRKAPMIELEPGRYVPNFAYRYLSEDVPYGLVVTRAVATLAGVETPAIDTVVTWAQEHLGKSYLADGAMTGVDLTDLPVPQNYGVRSLSDLVEWYTDSRMATVELRSAIS